jgi:hypothetical protein
VLEGVRRAEPADHWAGATLPLVYGWLGRDADAVRAAERAITTWVRAGDKSGETDARHQAALAYAVLGRRSAAIDQLEYLLSVPSWISAPGLSLDPSWDPLRGDPRFQRLLARTP